MEWSANSCRLDARSGAGGGLSTINQTRAKFSSLGTRPDIYAPGKDVYSYNRSALTIAADSGDSYAAAYVTGVAGLLKSFDPRLNGPQIRNLLLEGADSGNRIITNGRKLLNAYEALKAAARRPGARLCGNRVWTKNNKVYAERGATEEELFEAENVEFHIGYLIAHHAGRRLDLLDHTGVTRAWLWDQADGSWHESPAALGDDGSPNGVSWSLFGMSHDGVEETWYEYDPGNGDPEKVTVPRWDGIAVQSFAEIDVHPTRGDSTCVWEKWSGSEWVCHQAVWAGNSDSVVLNLSPAFSPPGDSVFAVIPVERTTITVAGAMSPCLWSTVDSTGHQTDQCVADYTYERRPLETLVYRLKYPGGSTALFATLSNLMVYSNAITEDGREFISEEGMEREQYTMVQATTGGFIIGDDYQRTFTNCAVAYRPLGNFQQPVHRVETEDACAAYGGLGTGAALRGPSLDGNRFHELVKRHLARPRSPE